MLSGQIRSAVIILIVTALNFSTGHAQVERACRTPRWRDTDGTTLR